MSTKRIITSYQSGTPIVEICERYIISRVMLYKLLHAAQVTLRHRPYQPRTPTPLARKRQARDQAIMRDRRAGMSTQRMAEKYFLTTMRIRQITQRPSGD
jgi:Mor family transcriptional regulator